MEPTIRPLSPDAQVLAGEPSNLAYARRIAASFASKVPWLRDEIEGAAMIGLCEAARSFDPGRGLRFKTLAARRIVGAIKDEMRASGVVKGNPRRGRFVTVEPLDEPTPSGDGAIGWEVESEDEVSQLTRNLPAQHKRAIRLVYGDCRAATRMGVGRVLGLSESRASQLVTRGIEMIRESLDGHASPTSGPDEGEPDAPEALPMPAADQGRTKSIYRGVSRESPGRWSARVHVAGKGLKYVGSFPSEEEAARAYDRAAIELNKPTEKLNFPDEAQPSSLPDPETFAKVPPEDVWRPVPPPAPRPAPAPRALARQSAPIATGDPEVEAIAAITRALTGLDQPACRRVIDWAISRFSLRSTI